MSVDFLIFMPLIGWLIVLVKIYIINLYLGFTLVYALNTHLINFMEVTQDICVTSGFSWYIFKIAMSDFIFPTPKILDNHNVILDTFNNT